ncbi:MAG: acyltransferase [Aeromicrobium sp.]|uniref:acyltransferase n=1 Tax=Aeromicrobium sp. TaxID=1871063 RepID=UPI00260B3868|nr:acyltransferase [Aeromicrobium sp.]MDF1706236.1 acyltransferase [Aeromicrobium sp.]
MSIRPAGSGLKFVAAEVIGRLPHRSLRTFLTSWVLGVQIGRDVRFHRFREIRHGRRIEVGTGSIIGLWATLDGRQGIRIGDNVNLSSEVSIWTQQHDYNSPVFATEGGPVTIGDRAWISYRTTILPGVSIGEGAVVAAGAVVTQDVEPFTVVGGIPAKKIAERSRDLTYDFGRDISGTPWFI